MSTYGQEFWGRAEWNRGGAADRYDRDVNGARYGSDYTRSSRPGGDRSQGYVSRRYDRYGEDYSYGGYSTGGGYGYGRARRGPGYGREDPDYRGLARWASRRGGSGNEYRRGSGSSW